MSRSVGRSGLVGRRCPDQDASVCQVCTCIAAFHHGFSICNRWQQRCTYSESSVNALFFWTGIVCVYSDLVCLLYSLVLGYGETSLLRYSAYDGLYTLTGLLMFAAIYRRRSSPVEDLPSTILRCVAANSDRSNSCKRYSWLHRLCYGGLSDQEVINFAITFPCSLLDFVCS